jgi:amidase
MPEGLEGMDATAQAELVSSGEVSAVELVEAAIARAEQVNPELNAIIHPLYEEGRAAAAGELREGPFQGVPFLFKDLGAGLAGHPFHMGMQALKDADFRLPVDTFVGARFRAAGLVTIGKTNTPELGILPTTEPDAYGATRNPWDPERTTGGSSGGAAAAVAAGIVPIAHASDGGGSIRIPASCCGLFGLKPTRARTSWGPLVGDTMSGLSVELVLSRSVRDVARALDAIEGPAPGDPYVAPPPVRPYVEELGADPGRLRIAVLTEPLAGSGVEVDLVVQDAARDAAAMLEGLGHAVDEDAPQAPAGASDPIETFLTRWFAGQAEALDRFSIILGREIGPDDVEPLTWAMAEEGRRRHSGQYLSAVSDHQALGRMLGFWFESGHDLLLTPTLGEVTPPLGTFDDSGGDPMRAIHRAERMGVFTAPINAMGLPAMSLPLGESPEGLPVGIHLIAPFGREDVLIRLAAQVESAHPWAHRRPPVFAGEPAGEPAAGASPS